MSLRLRLFLLLAGLVVVLVGTQAVLVRALAAQLDENVQTVAFRVGEEILSGFRFEVDQSVEAGETSSHVVMVTTDDSEGTATRIERIVPAAPGGAAGDATPEPEGAEHPPNLKWVIRREVEVRNEPGGAESTVHKRTFDFTTASEEGARAVVLEPSREPDVLFLHTPSERPRAIQIPRGPVASTLERFRSQLFAGSLAMLVIGLIAAAVVAHRATRPMGELADAARRIGEGELGVEVPASQADEVGVALASFNRMSRRLAELDRENRRLAQSERLSELGEVARGLAHTLRNPLNALGLSIEQLAGEAGPDAGRATELVESSRRQIRRMDGALRSFLALASAGAAAPETVDVAALAREVALEAIQDASGRVRVEVSAPPEPVRLSAVPAELGAALQALVVNACEASPEGARVGVTVTAVEGGGARLTVDDEGPGVADAVAARLFEPHVTTKPHGSGIGLFLARRIAAGRYGGTVTLAPRAGGGTRAALEVGDRIGAAG